MPRASGAGRLDELVHAAALVFGQKGYRRAQMSDLAAELGVAQGTLYAYVESKEALLYLVVDRSCAAPGFERPTPDLPVPSPRPGDLVARLGERAAELVALPLLYRAARRRRTSDAAGEVADVIGELFDVVAATRELADVVEQSAPDLPSVALAFFAGVRRPVLDTVTRWVHRRTAAGQFESVAEPAVTARIVVELVTWFARHRHRDPDAPIDDKTARAATIAFVSHALLHQGMPTP